MKDSQIVLSKRLQMLADMVTPGYRLADVGCDHGFLSIYLVQAGVCPKALAMDVRKGPLAGAKEHVEEAGLREYIETRLSDGLKEYAVGEADALVCAGMGGRLMEKILTDSMDKVKQLKELILQPQSEIREFREFLRNEGFLVTAENAVYEEGKYYFAMKVVWSGAKKRGNDAGDDVQRLYDLFGEKLLLQKNPVLMQYLQQRESYIRQLEMSLAAAGSKKATERLREVKKELVEIESAFIFFQKV